jgi:hypothetical protein
VLVVAVVFLNTQEQVNMLLVGVAALATRLLFQRH